MKLSAKVFIYFMGCLFLSLADVVMYRNFHFVAQDHILIWTLFILFMLFDLLRPSAQFIDEYGNSYSFYEDDENEDDDEDNYENEDDEKDGEEDDDGEDYQDLDESYGASRHFVLFDLNPDTMQFEGREIF